MPVTTLPGPVEIDECHIVVRVSGTHGRLPAPGKIVFGIKCRTTGRVVVFPVQSKGKEVLLPILVSHVAQGATVISDKFSTYIKLGQRSVENDL